MKIMGTNQKGFSLLFAILIILAVSSAGAVVYFYFFNKNNVKSQYTDEGNIEVQGELIQSSDCEFQITPEFNDGENNFAGILVLRDSKNKYEEMKQYAGKKVKIKGHVFGQSFSEPCSCIPVGYIENIERISLAVAEINSGNSAVDTSNWQTYRNEDYGFEIKYPGSLKLTESGKNDYGDMGVASGLATVMFSGSDSHESPLGSVFVRKFESKCMSQNFAGAEKFDTQIEINGQKQQKCFHPSFGAEKVTIYSVSIGKKNNIYFDFSCGNISKIEVCDQMLRNVNFFDPRSNNKYAEAFVPIGWRIIEELESDFNADGIKDIAMTIENQNAGEEFKKLNCGIGSGAANKDFCRCHQENCLRNLFILFGNKSGGFDLSAKSENVILSADEGGVFGDPFEGLAVDNGSILIKFYGGSAWRWSDVLRFRYQDNGWYLIGRTKHNYHVGCPYQVFQSQDYNYLTGYMEKITGVGYMAGDNLKENFVCNASLTSESGNAELINEGKKTLTNLKDFNIH